MIGLVFAETLGLTWLQWSAVGLNSAGWLMVYRHLEEDGSLCLPAGHRADGRPVMLTALLTCSGLCYAFWNDPVSIDHLVLFEQARYLARFAWGDFLEAFTYQPYVEYQPPFLTFWFSRLPVLWLHQLLHLPCALLYIGLMHRLYGRAATLLCATPVFALMLTQPSGDLLLFGTLLMVLRLCQLADERRAPGQEGRAVPPERLAAALLYGLSWMIKPLTLLTLPFMLPHLGWIGLGSLAFWGAYIWWTQQWEFGQRQLNFLLHQLCLKRMSVPGSFQTGPDRPHPSFFLQVWQALRWRWDRLGRRALPALPFYLFPLWLWRCSWQGLALTAMIVVGYGNPKYLLLALLFIFPLQDGRNRGGCETDKATWKESLMRATRTHAHDEHRKGKMNHNDPKTRRKTGAQTSVCIVAEQRHCRAMPCRKGDFALLIYMGDVT